MKRKRSKLYRKVGVIAGSIVALIALAGWYLSQHDIPVLQPGGTIASQERDLITFCVLLSLLVMVPVFTLLAYFGRTYRATNTKARYQPELGGNKWAETIWWLVPGILMVIISVLTWRSSYALDPYKSLAKPGQKTVHVQVVALDWKWLFIYPDYGVASVNQLALPVHMPVKFDITSDTVMTSFWIPKLGSQMYAMPGMNTKLNLRADTVGEYPGTAANISGEGFAGMKFTAKVLEPAAFEQWTKASHLEQTAMLDAKTYATLAKPTKDVPPMHYGSVQAGLYNDILMKYMTPMSGVEQTADTPSTTDMHSTHSSHDSHGGM